MNELATVAPKRVSAIIPRTLDETAQLAQLIHSSGLAPKGMSSPQAIMISIMRGLEIGLTPFQAIDKLPTVNGRTLLMGEAALSLVRSSGKADFVEEKIVGEGEKRVAVCKAKRGEEIIERTFSVEDAIKAGLWKKPGPWTQYPNRMLTMRARAFCLRDGFPDLLNGLYLAEEFDVTEEDKNQFAPPEPPPEPITSEQILELQELIKETGSNEKQFLDYLKVPALTELNAKSYELGKKALLNKKAKANG
jgi:hypothetical protein